MQITFKDYVKSFPKIEKELDGQAMCAMKWIYSYVHLGDGVAKGCHNVPHRYVSHQDVITYGKDIFVNHPYEIERRNDKLKNIKHKECQACWDSENKGVRSCRLPEPYYKMHQTRFGVNDTFTVMPTMIEIAFNNTCDLKCIYCSSAFSSQWETEDKKFNVFAERQTTAPNGFADSFWQWLEEDAVDSLLQYYILGGEPIIQPEFYDFLDKLIPLLKRRPNKFGVKPQLVILTNGNTPEKYLKKWFDKVKELNEVITVQFHISVEGFESRAEYIRTNLDWNRFSTNVDKILQFSKLTDIRFSITHSVMSITSCLDLLKWIKLLKDKHNVEVDLIRTSVSNPAHLAPWMLTLDFKMYIDEVCSWINNCAPEWQSYNEFLLGLANSFGNHTTEDLKKFNVWEQDMFNRRGLDISTIFPEMKTWIAYSRYEN